MEEKRDLLDLSQPEIVSADRSSLLTRDNVHSRERGSQNRCISRKSTHRDTNPFMWKILDLRGNSMCQNHPNLLLLLSNGDTTCSSLESIKIHMYLRYQ
jgi:hypothetical protein